MMKSKRAAAYCRVSTGKECQEGSYETQRSYFTELLSHSHDEKLIRVYADEGSGRSTQRRPQFRQMLQDCEDGKIDKLLREDDEVVYGDSGYLGIQKRPEIRQNTHFSNIDFRINRRPSSLPRVSDNAIDWERYIENRKSFTRCKIEHVFRIIKCQFGYRKVAYRGLKKNENRLYAMFACANLYSLAIAGRKLSTT